MGHVQKSQFTSLLPSSISVLYRLMALALPLLGLTTR
jgi:hypothetical protein